MSLADFPTYEPCPPLRNQYVVCLTISVFCNLYLGSITSEIFIGELYLNILVSFNLINLKRCWIRLRGQLILLYFRPIFVIELFKTFELQVSFNYLLLLFFRNNSNCSRVRHPDDVHACRLGSGHSWHTIFKHQTL